MKIVRASIAAAGILLVVLGSGAHGENPAGHVLRPPSAFVDAYVSACQPVEYDFAGIRQDLNESGTWVHDNLFVGVYAGSCRDFYFVEVVPRLDPGLRPLLMPVEHFTSMP